MRNLGLLLVVVFLLSFQSDWGFFAHRRINELAVFTLPPDLIIFYKKHFDYIGEEAVGPDKRRYASKFEAIRHYIDLDVWGAPPYENLPRNWTDALIQHTDIKIIFPKGDSLYLFENQQFRDSISTKSYRAFFVRNIIKGYYEEEWVVDGDSLSAYFGSDVLPFGKCEVIDTLSEFGILPWHLQSMQRKITKAFSERNLKALLRHSADMGHYIGDAHVPLHTTENYNGQLTNQKGIHGFWESRLPELYADETYDFWVGKAEYIEDKETYFWDIVLNSHSLVDSVLLIEKDLSQTFPKEQQYCMEERGAVLMQMPCPGYAKAFHERMDGMVERQMRNAILAIGNSWYTAWVDAGMPDMRSFEQKNDEPEVDKETEKAYKEGKIIGRPHGQ